jgi:hypothetical protein
LSLYPRSNPADDLPRDRADRRGHFAHVNLLPRLVALTADDHYFVARLHIADLGHIDRHHVHRHRAEDRGAAAAHQHLPAPLETQSRPSA